MRDPVDGAEHARHGLPYTFTALALWEELFVVLILLKLPVAYVGYVLWWAIKAEPELGAEGGTEGMNWAPWKRPSPSGSQSESQSGPRRGRPRRTRERQGQPRRPARARGAA